MLEQRRSIRRRTLLTGRIRVEKLGAWAVDCTVRNVSDDGANIAIPGDTIVPTTFALGISGRQPVAARLVWARGGRAGVALGERRQPVPEPWTGPCRRVAPPAATANTTDRVQARIQAIVSRRRPAGSQGG